MPLVAGERIKMRDHAPTVIKQLEPQGVSVLYPITPRRVSVYSNADKQLIKPEYKHLADRVFVPTQNRAYRRAMRKPFRPMNLRRRQAQQKAAWAASESEGQK